jgi:hypothetical protein
VAWASSYPSLPRILLPGTGPSLGGYFLAFGTVITVMQVGTIVWEVGKAGKLYFLAPAQPLTLPAPSLIKIWKTVNNIGAVTSFQ